MEKSKAIDERPTSVREASVKRRTFDMGEVLGMRHLRTVTVDWDVPKPSAPASDERGELIKRQEAEMRKVLGQEPEWGIDNLQPERSKPTGE